MDSVVMGMDGRSRETGKDGTCVVTWMCRERRDSMEVVCGDGHGAWTWERRVTYSKAVELCAWLGLTL